MTTNAQAALAAAATTGVDPADVLTRAGGYLTWLNRKDAQRPPETTRPTGGPSTMSFDAARQRAASLQPDPLAQGGYVYPPTLAARGGFTGRKFPIGAGGAVPVYGVEWGLLGERTTPNRPAHKFPVPLTVTLTKEDVEILSGVRQHIKGKEPLKIKSTPRAPVLVEREGNLTTVTFLETETDPTGDAA